MADELPDLSDWIKDNDEIQDEINKLNAQADNLPNGPEKQQIFDQIAKRKQAQVALDSEIFGIDPKDGGFQSLLDYLGTNPTPEAIKEFVNSDKFASKESISKIDEFHSKIKKVAPKAISKMSEDIAKDTGLTKSDIDKIIENLKNNPDTLNKLPDNPPKDIDPSKWKKFNDWVKENPTAMSILKLLILAGLAVGGIEWLLNWLNNNICNAAAENSGCFLMYSIASQSGSVKFIPSNSDPSKLCNAYGSEGWPTFCDCDKGENGNSTTMCSSQDCIPQEIKDRYLQIQSKIKDTKDPLNNYVRYDHKCTSKYDQITNTFTGLLNLLEGIPSSILSQLFAVLGKYWWVFLIVIFFIFGIFIFIVMLKRSDKGSNGDKPSVPTKTVPVKNSLKT